MSTSPGPSGARQRSKHASSTTPGSGLGSGSDSESASNQETLKTTTRPSTASSKRKKDNGSAGLTVLKALAGLVVFVPALSYLIMDGESFTFGYNPRWLKWEYWVRAFIFCYFIPPPYGLTTQSLNREYSLKLKKKKLPCS